MRIYVFNFRFLKVISNNGSGPSVSKQNHKTSSCTVTKRAGLTSPQDQEIQKETSTVSTQRREEYLEKDMEEASDGVHILLIFCLKEEEEEEEEVEERQIF